MSGGDRPTGTLTLFFSDMEGSTRLARALGDAWPALLARHRDLLREVVETEGGTVVDCQGDSMFAVFRSAAAGVRAASEAQRRMAAETWPDRVAVRVRIGVHTGEPAQTVDGGYAGVDVSHAARLCAAGHGGQVLLSESARLIFALALDERMPASRKVLLAGAAGYLIVGRDLIPDEVPILGGLDDLVIVVLAVDLFLDGVPAELLAEKLNELGIDRVAFDQDMARVRRMTPGPVRKTLRRVPGMVAQAGEALENSRVGPRVRNWISKEDSIA